MPDRFARVSDEIYRGGKPSAEDLRLMKDVYGIKTIISLDGTIGGEIAQIVDKLGMDHVVIPIGGLGSAPLIEYLKNNIASILSNQQPVYLHCRHGSDRTGMAIAFYRMQKDGWSPDAALKEAKSFNFGDKLDENTEKLYRSAILGNDDNSTYDSALFSTINQFDNIHPPAYSPQQSFSVPEDIKYNGPDESLANPPPEFKDPYAFITNRTPSSSDDNKRNLRRVMLEQISSGVPQVGGRDGGSVPVGVGPTETSGFLNL